MLADHPRPLRPYQEEALFPEQGPFPLRPYQEEAPSPRRPSQAKALGLYRAKALDLFRVKALDLSRGPSRRRHW